MSDGYAPKVATAKINLAKFGGEGEITVRAMNTRMMREMAKLNKEYKNEDGNDVEANILVAIYICKNCIIDAPFEITDEVIDDFPPELTTEISSTAIGLQKEIPLA